MAKYVSNGDKHEDMKHYQKLLIPLNIVVCVLCLVSIFTLMFAPILRIDVAKIVSSNELSSYIKDTVTKSLNGGNDNQSSVSADGNWAFTTSAAKDTGNNSNANGGSGSSSSNDGISDEMISAISTSVIDPLLQSIGKSDISLNFTAFSSLKVLTGGKEALKTELSDMVAKFADGLIDAILNLFDNGAIVNTIVEVSLPTIINTSIDTMKKNPETPQNVIDLLDGLTKEKINELCEKIKGLQTTTTPQQFINKIVEIAPDLMLSLTGNELSSEQLDALREEITKMVDETVEKVHEQDPNKTFNYNLEAFLCIQISQQVEIDELNTFIKDMIKGGDTDGNNNGSSLAYAMDGKVDGNGNSNVDNGNSGSDTTKEKNYKIYTSFSDILSSMNTQQSGIGDTIRDAVNEKLDELGDDIDSFATMYGFLFIFVAIFMVLWLILFLFSLLHIFAKNKRFMMWYVKLLCWIPGIIWLVLTLASMPAVIAAIAGTISAEVPVSVIAAVMGGISSWGTGVSYICYWILWLVSIFWAFPIKHKIRKLKKEIKREEKAQQA